MTELRIKATTLADKANYHTTEGWKLDTFKMEKLSGILFNTTCQSLYSRRCLKYVEDGTRIKHTSKCLHQRSTEFQDKEKIKSDNIDRLRNYLKNEDSEISPKGYNQSMDIGADYRYRKSDKSRNFHNDKEKGHSNTISRKLLKDRGTARKGKKKSVVINFKMVKNLTVPSIRGQISSKMSLKCRQNYERGENRKN